jgi:hypothetical protein
MWTIEDRCESTLHYLPFNVPHGTGALKVELDFDSRQAVLDLGCLGPSRFRGWSGGARRYFVIGAESATPGYLSGEPEPGTWFAVVGLHKIPAGGVKYELTATTSGVTAPASDDGQLPPVTDRPDRRELPADAGMRWLAGDLHAHTVHSDGAMTVQELARYATSRGLEFLAVTDHNTLSHHGELPAAAATHGITLAGQEVTTSMGTRTPSAMSDGSTSASRPTSG